MIYGETLAQSKNWMEGTLSYDFWWVSDGYPENSYTITNDWISKPTQVIFLGIDAWEVSKDGS